MTIMRTRDIINDARHRIIALESVEMVAHSTDAGFSCTAHITPLVVIVSGGGELYGFDMEGERLDLAALREKLSGMEAEGTVDAALLP